MDRKWPSPSPPPWGADTWLPAFKTQPVCLCKKQKQVQLQGAGPSDVCWENAQVGKSPVGPFSKCQQCESSKGINRPRGLKKRTRVSEAQGPLPHARALRAPGRALSRSGRLPKTTSCPAALQLPQSRPWARTPSSSLEPYLPFPTREGSSRLGKDHRGSFVR